LQQSALLPIVAGLENTSGGKFSLGGRQVGNQSPKAQDISLVFQNQTPLPHMALAGNWAPSAALDGGFRPCQAARVARPDEILLLWHLLGRYHCRSTHQLIIDEPNGCAGSIPDRDQPVRLGGECKRIAYLHL
jgi:ABC-type sugar transport system ATPase subunit